jgi:nucleoside-diphosphate-sugar epimerase
VRAFVTGGTGFVGRRLVAALGRRGDEVATLVRSREKAAGLAADHLVEGDLSDPQRLTEQMSGADAVFHLAAIYKIGIPVEERRQMYETNVTGTENVLDAAAAAGVRRIVYVSTVNAFGDTGGRVVDESYERPDDRYVSTYDYTKHRAHEAARQRIARGVPVVIVQPGVIYGPGDHSEIGGQIRRAARGRLPFVSFPTLGMNAVYVDDVVDGILLAHDRGRVGEAYVLGGEITTMAELVRAAAEAAGRRPPRVTLPTSLMKPLAALGPSAGRLLAGSPNMRELISASDGVTYWATDAKAREELGYSPRPLAEGLRATVGRPAPP